MKKAGSSDSKSKTPRSSKKTGAEPFAVVGHTPAHSLSPADESLFRAFQSNLLSLISHELRTPLMGILNSLTLLEEPEGTAEFSAAELIAMARRNAQRLQRNLSALLDLAAMDSGTFHARLREVDLVRLARSRVTAHEPMLRDQRIDLELSGERPLLADPQKLGRAIDLCLDLVLARGESGTPIKLRISSEAKSSSRKAELSLSFKLKPGSDEAWRDAWSQAVAGYQAGAATPASAFAGTLQSEQAFLTRAEEGLGSEFLLILEILRLHQGTFDARMLPGSCVQLTMTLPELSSEEGLRAVLASRTHAASMELGSVALCLVQVPEGTSIETFRAQVKKNLFRASDAVYSLPERSQLALVMDDCKPEDAPRLLARIEKGLGWTLHFGIASCPAEGYDPIHLIELASKRLQAL